MDWGAARRIRQWRARGCSARKQSGQPTIGTQLLSDQQNQLQQLLKEFTDVLQSKPGRTYLVEHFIDTGNASPIHCPLYRVSLAYCDLVKAEQDQLLESGPSSSQWAAPLVLDCWSKRKTAHWGYVLTIVVWTVYLELMLIWCPASMTCWEKPSLFQQWT